MKLLFSFVLLACAAPQLRAEEFVFKGGTQSEGKVLSFEKGDFNLLINDKKEKKAGIQIQSISWGEAGVPITPTSGELKDQLITLEKFEGGKFFIKLQDGTSKELTSMSLGRIVFGSGEKISYASKGGEKFEIAKALEPGAVTVFDFYADWCGPCLKLAPALEELIKNSDGVVLKKVNIVNWDSPVAKQYGLKSIPAIRIYGADGKEIYNGGGNLAAIEQVIKKHSK
ncbi:MAG: thioredoxin family protein [Verrucomicrobiota bacterium]|nr:thioredoxin family protein [Verrucomicrobiota bacterium]